jgi:thiamine-phosphate pyrophosphorylase
VNRAALASVRLIALTDRSVASSVQTLARLERLVRHAPPQSVLVQLRDRELATGERFRFGLELRALTRAHAQLFQVNDRLDLALLLDADGVHLGEHAVSTTDARSLLGEARFVTRACHDPERAPHEDADGILLSPVFAPRKGAAPLGVGALTRARQRLRESGRNTLVFALGGVDAGNAARCLDAGADGVAAIGSVVGCDTPEALLPALRIAV